MQRLTPAEILKQYQVEGDHVEEDWQPSIEGFGLIPIPGTDPHTITETEAFMLNQLSFYEMYLFRDITKDAFKAAVTWLPDPATIPSYAPAASTGSG